MAQIKFSVKDAKLTKICNAIYEGAGFDRFEDETDVDYAVRYLKLNLIDLLDGARRTQATRSVTKDTDLFE